MSASDKPDPAQAWRFAQKLLADEELERLDKMSDAEVDAELRAEGRGPSWVPSAESLLAGAEKHAAAAKAAEEARGASVVPLRTPERPARPARMVWLIAAAIGAMVVLLAAVEGSAIVAFFKGEKVEPIRPDNERPAQPTPREAAEKLRAEAVALCESEVLGTCRDKLDEARKLDPAGESEPRVQEARARIQSRMYPDANFDGKPRGK